MLFLRVFILKPTERAKVLLKNGTRGFQNSPSFKKSACFYVTISESLRYTNAELKIPPYIQIHIKIIP